MGIWRYYLQKWEKRRIGEKRLRRYGGHCFRRVLLRCQLDIQVRMLNRQPREEVTKHGRSVCYSWLIAAHEPCGSQKHCKLVIKQSLLKIKLYKLTINIFKKQWSFLKTGKRRAN